MARIQLLKVGATPEVVLERDAEGFDLDGGKLLVVTGDGLQASNLEDMQRNLRATFPNETFFILALTEGKTIDMYEFHVVKD